MWFGSRTLAWYKQDRGFYPKQYWEHKQDPKQINKAKKLNQDMTRSSVETKILKKKYARENLNKSNKKFKGGVYL